MVYEAAEDSLLLASVVKKYAHGRVLDMGTGSGIQAITAAKKKTVTSVLAVDKDPEAVKTVKELSKKIKHRELAAATSDLFTRVRGKFDTIIFNPPYLPQDEGVEDIALYGGKKGYEVVEKFLLASGKHLTRDGCILLLFSSLTNRAKVDEILEACLFEHTLEATQHLFMEELYVYKILKNAFLKDLEGHGVTDVHYFDHGKRGLIYKGKYRGKAVAIKTKRPSSEAFERVANEARMLKRLASYRLAPRMCFATPKYVVYHFVEGPLLLDYLEQASAKQCKDILLACVKQCALLDRIGLKKEEMHRPVKHIFIENHKPVMIDFERAHYTIKSHNVTQFVSFLAGGNVRLRLAEKGIHLPTKTLQKLAQTYQKGKVEEICREIMKA